MSKKAFFDDEMDSDDDDIGPRSGSGAVGKLGTAPYQDKRAHHNALERKRRDHIKESFSSLRDSIPTLAQGDKSSRAQILKKASEYITQMRKKNAVALNEVDEIKRQNQHIEAQIKALEKAKNAGQFQSANEVLSAAGLNYEMVSSILSEDVSSSTIVLDSNQESGSDTSESGLGSKKTNSSTITPSNNPKIVEVRSVQPGQSLLIHGGAQSVGEPSKKRPKTINY